MIVYVRITYSAQFQETHAASNKQNFAGGKLRTNARTKQEDFKTRVDTDKNEFSARTVTGRISQTSNPSGKHFWDRNIHKRSGRKRVIADEKQGIQLLVKAFEQLQELFMNVSRETFKNFINSIKRCVCHDHVWSTKFEVNL